MKIAISLLWLTFITAFLHAQPVLPENTSGAQIIGLADNETGFPRLERSPENQNRFLLRYCNSKYKQARVTKAIAFQAGPDQLKELYDFLKEQFSSDVAGNLKLGEDELLVQKKNIFLEISVLHKNNESSFFSLSEEQLDKLFQDL